MKILKILLIVILIISPFPIGYMLIEKSFLTSFKPHLFHGDIPVNEIPDNYYPKNRGFYFEIPEGPSKGNRLFYQDTVLGAGAPLNTVIFVHGNPSSSYIFHDTIDQLEKTTKTPLRIIAMDLIGFGLSDRASTRLYPWDHAENLLQLITYLDLYNITLVVHDWGGPIGIGALLKVPDTVSGLVLINTTVFKLTSVDIIFNPYKVSLFDTSTLMSFIPDFSWGRFTTYSIFAHPGLSIFEKLGFMQSLIWSSQGHVADIHPEEVQFYSRHLRSKQNIRNSRLLYENSRYFLGNSALPNVESEQSMENFIGLMDQKLAEKWGPNGSNIRAYGLFGDQDILSDPIFTDKWLSALPQLNGHLKIVENGGHYIQNEHPEMVAEAVINVIQQIQADHTGVGEP